MNGKEEFFVTRKKKREEYPVNPEVDYPMMPGAGMGPGMAPGMMPGHGMGMYCYCVPRPMHDCGYGMPFQGPCKGGYHPGYGYNPGMMDPGYDPGYGYDPGMMDPGYGYGPGMNPDCPYAGKDPMYPNYPMMEDDD